MRRRILRPRAQLAGRKGVLAAVRLAILIAVLTLALPASAGAAGWKRVDGIGPVVTDGRDLAAWLLDDGTVRVRDGAGRRDFALPTVCEEERPLIAAGGGRILLACPGGLFGRRYSLMDAADGTVSPTPPLNYPDLQNATHDYAIPSAVGERWMRVSVSGYHYTVTNYVNLETGKFVVDPEWRHAAADLNSPGLWRALCAPLHRRQDPAYDDAADVHDRLLAYQYEHPFGLPLRIADRRLVLDRCGRPPRTLSRCPDWCRSETLSDGVVAWAERRRVHIYDARTGERRRWRAPKRDRDTGIALTRDRIYAIRPTGDAVALYVRRF
jgi:hypothetical protein